MQKLKVCFVGIGSIAKRHIRNLGVICKKRQIKLTIDAFRHNPVVADIDGISNVYYEIGQVPDDYDVIFITNPTIFHFETLNLFHLKGKNFFIEKPIVSPDQLEKAKHFHIKEKTVYYVACPLRYNAVIQYLKEYILSEKVFSVRSISSSYLPAWRLGQDYRESYSAHKKLGGGVSIDLIHEWDYITYLFGEPNKVYHLTGKKSGLEIDSDDYAVYIAEYDKCVAELHLDYFGRKTLREIMIFTENDTIVGDIVNNRITFLSKEQVIDFKEERDDYQRKELECFLDMISGIIKIEDGYWNGIKVLELTQGILEN